MAAKKNLKAARLLAEWKAREPEWIETSRIEAHPYLQVRSIALARPQHRRSVELASKEHVERLRTHYAEGEQSTTPLLVARIKGGPHAGKLFIVDGHHRHLAARREQVGELPCRVIDASMKDSGAVAGLANVEDRALALSKAETAELQWQTIGELTAHGRVECTASVRDLESWYPGGYKKSQLAKMIQRAAKMPGPHPALVLNPLTGWPTWKSTCAALTPEGEPADPHEDLRELVKELQAAVWGGAASFRDPELAVRGLIAALRDDIADSPYDLADDHAAAGSEF